MKKNQKLSGVSRSKDNETSSLRSRKFHKDWRTWVALILMLTAMAVYVLTLDDSVQPTGGIEQQGGLSTSPTKP